MKAFEEWWQNTEQPFRSNKVTVKRAWKAALKWANSIDTDSCIEGYACWLKMQIDEELEDG